MWWQMFKSWKVQQVSVNEGKSEGHDRVQMKILICNDERTTVVTYASMDMLNTEKCKQSGIVSVQRKEHNHVCYWTWFTKYKIKRK